MKKAIAYIRVSTDDQVKNGVSLENQAERIQDYCGYKDIEIIDEIKDEGVSGGLTRHARALLRY